MQPQVPDKARIAEGCALHEGAPFVAICRRCGSYICKQCTEDGRFVECTECRERLAQEAADQRRAAKLSLSHAITNSWRVYTKNVGLITLTMLGVALAVVASPVLWVALVGAQSGAAASITATFVALVAYVVVCTLAISGALEIGIRLMAGEPASLTHLWSNHTRISTLLAHGMLVWCALFFCAVLPITGLVIMAFQVGQQIAWPFIALSGLVFFGLGGYVALGLCFGAAEIVSLPELDSIEALRNSWKLARGARLRILALLSLLWLSFALGTLLFSVGLLFTLGYALLLYSAFYLKLRDKAEAA